MLNADHKITHDAEVGHAHTVMVIEQDSLGRFWLTFRCSKRTCSGQKLVEILPEQVKSWQQAGVIAAPVQLRPCA
jgi:hypothetical protein